MDWADVAGRCRTDLDSFTGKPRRVAARAALVSRVALLNVRGGPLARILGGAIHTGVLFRRARATDVAAVVALIESAYRGEGSRAGWTTEANLLDGQRTDAAEVGALVAATDSRILVFEDGAGLLGSVLVEDRAEAAYIGMLAVRPTEQGKGFGHVLLAEAERVARETLGHATARMTVLVQRPELIAWYERRGYRRSGQREPFFYGQSRFGVPRRSDLEFEVLIKTLT